MNGDKDPVSKETSERELIADFIGRSQEAACKRIAEQAAYDIYQGEEEPLPRWVAQLARAKAEGR